MLRRLTVSRLPLLGAVCLALATSVSARAQGPPDTLRLSLADAVRRVLEESEEMATARARLAQTQAQVTQATAAVYPQLNTGLTYSRAIRTIFDAAAAPPGADTTRIPDAFDPTVSVWDRYDILSESISEDMLAGLFGALPFGRRNTYIASLQLSQTLFAGGRVRRGIDFARHAQTSAELTIEETEADLTLQVHTAYLDAVLARRLLTIALQSRGVAEQHFRQVEAFYRSGTASDFDLLRARVDFENRELPVVQAEQAARIAELTLKQLVNVPADQPLGLVTDRAPPEIAVDEAALRRFAATRPALEAAGEAVAMGEAGVRMAQAQHWPAVQLVGNIGFQAYPSTVLPPGFGDWRSDWSVALAVSWTPSNGFRTRGRVAEAQAQMRQATLAETQLRETIEMQVEAALAEYRTAYEQVRARRETIVMAERALQLAEVRFASGLSTQLEVSDAALLLDQARVNEVQATSAWLARHSLCF